MGLFDFLEKQFKNFQDNVEDAQMEVKYYNEERICNALYNLSSTSISKMVGYSQVLRKRCEYMSNENLKSIFDYAYYKRNIRACNAMMPVMSSRGLAYKNKDGKIIKMYK